MFGATPEKSNRNWADMYWHNKAHYIVDYASDCILSSYRLWLPAVGLSMLGSIALFSPEAPFSLFLGMLSAQGSPIVSVPMFGRKLEGGFNSEEEVSEDFDDEEF